MILPKTKKNIVLIGLMGTGKTLVSKALALQMNWQRFGTDELIEAKEKATISVIVAQKGWPYFRQLEHEIVKKLVRKKNVIIDCGGGVVLNPENLKLLKSNGIVFHLKADPDVIVGRLKGDVTRPLINEPNPKAKIKAILKERLPLYNQADFTIDASDPSVQVPIVEILSKV